MFKITLRWRITLLTMAVMLVSSISLIVFININTNRILPHAADTIIQSGFATASVHGVAITGGKGYHRGKARIWLGRWRYRPVHLQLKVL